MTTTSKKTVEQIVRELGAPTPEDKIHRLSKPAHKGQACTPNMRHCTLYHLPQLDYVDARFIMDRLDEVVPGLWQDRYERLAAPRDGLVCGISIKLDGEWVTRYDTSDASTIEPEKGEFSGAFKRAGVKWGIGRDLYFSEEDRLARALAAEEAVATEAKSNVITPVSVEVLDADASTDLAAAAHAVGLKDEKMDGWLHSFGRKLDWDAITPEIETWLRNQISARQGRDAVVAKIKEAVAETTVAPALAETKVAATIATVATPATIATVATPASITPMVAPVSITPVATPAAVAEERVLDADDYALYTQAAIHEAKREAAIADVAPELVASRPTPVRTVDPDSGRAFPNLDDEPF